MLLHGDKLRMLFWLRWKMFQRSFSRGGARRIIGTIFLTIFVLFVSGSIAVSTYAGYRFAPTPINSELLFVVLTGVYVLWFILPLLEFSVNEGLDVSKLALFPLTRAELMSSLVFSTLLDIPTLGLFLVFAAVVAGWGTSIPLVLLAFLAMLIFYIQVVGMSQLVLALLMRTLQSRRFRDLGVILAVLLASSGYLCQLVIRGAVATNSIGLLTTGSLSTYLQWLPPGMAARAIQQAAIGNWGMSFVWLVALALVSIIVLYLWQMIVENGLTSSESSATTRIVRRRNGRVGQVEQAGGTRQTVATNLQTVPARRSLLPAPLLAILQKDLRYFWRDPQIKATFIQSILSILFPIFYFGLTILDSSGRRSGLAFLGPFIEMIVPVFALLSLYSLSYNVLGMERQSLTTLFLFPIEPKYILWGKNLLVLVIGLLEITLLVVLGGFLTNAWNLVPPALTIGIAGIGIILGFGNITSVFFPQRMRQAFRGFQSSSNMTAEGGCLRGLLSLAAFVVMLIVLVPVALALILPIIFHSEWIWGAAIPASLAYGAAFYYIATRLVAPRIVSQAPEILARIVRE